MKSYIIIIFLLCIFVFEWFFIIYLSSRSTTICDLENYDPNKKYVSCNYIGGLGNQLFGIYTSLSYGLRFNKEPVFLFKDSIYNKTSVNRRNTYWNTLFKNLKTIKDEDFNKIKWNDINENGKGTYESSDNNNIIFNGNLQSYQNFINELDKINKVVGIEEQKTEVKKMYNKLFDTDKKVIGIHFRLSDYRVSDVHNILPNEYYVKSLKQIGVTDQKILVFCEKEDYDIVTNRITDITKSIQKENYPFEIVKGENELDELFLISLCDIIITANSTFSWWAAVFSGHKNVYLPVFRWYNDTNTDRFVLPGWKLIKETEYKQKIIFMAFGGPTENYHKTLKRLCKEAEDINIFDDIVSYTEKDLQNDKDFWQKHRIFLENNKRGYGYWLWKSYLIKKHIEKINDNDILFYIDAGCSINKNGRTRLIEYIEMLNNHKEYGIIGFKMDFNLEKKWTKNKLLKEFNFENNEDILNSGQFLATVVLLKKNQHSKNIINEWYKYSSIYNLINDETENENKEFKEHRHDQSILSLLRKKYGSILLLDEIDFSESDKPFWATRLL